MTIPVPGTTPCVASHSFHQGQQMQADIKDSRGLPITAPDRTAVERLEDVINDIYYYRLGTADKLDALLSDHPEFTLAQVQKGYSHMGEAMLPAHARAQERLRLAEALPATRRERLHQEALRAWIAQDFTARAAAWEQILLEWPRDLLAFRQYTGALFWSGDKKNQAQVTSGVATHWDESVPGFGHFLSAHAFAMEEVGLYDVAERAARDALAIEPQDLWAQHALAHVLEMQGRVKEGIESLERAAGFLNNYNLFRGHLWWHLALFKLSEARYDEVLELFDREIFPKPSLFYLDIQNGASLLARLEFQGVDVGAARWERLAQASLAGGTQCTLWFTAMHRAMALARTGQLSALNETLDYLQNAGGGSPQAALAHELSVAAAALYQDKPREALERLLLLRGQRGDLGASHAQQDLYDQMMVVAALQLGDWARVRQVLKARISSRVWEGGTSWGEFDARARAIDTIEDVAAVREELRWKALVH